MILARWQRLADSQSLLLRLPVADRWSIVKPDEPHSTTANTRLFLTLIAATSLALVALLVLLWAVPVIGLSNMPPAVTWLNAAFFFSLICATLWLAISLILAVVLKKPVLFSNRVRGIERTSMLNLALQTWRRDWTTALFGTGTGSTGRAIQQHTQAGD